MTRLLHGLLLFMLHIISRLPFTILYLLADVIGFLLCHVVRYRRHLVEKNIARSFPEMTPARRSQIVRQFYRNFADNIVETIKLLHISDSEISRRMEFVNVEHIDRLLAGQRSIVAYFSHCGNWEWAPSVTLHTRRRQGDGVEFCQVYRPLRNQWFDSMMLKIRSRFGSLSFKKTSVLRDLLKLRRDGITSITGFMSDQKPSHGDPIHVISFLNRPTAVITGTATLANRLAMAAVYWDMEKISRGHYRITVRPMTDDASTCDPLDLTDRYFKMLEQTIRRDPAIWLWTHNRWKHKVSFEDNKK